MDINITKVENSKLNDLNFRKYSVWKILQRPYVRGRLRKWRVEKR